MTLVDLPHFFNNELQPPILMHLSVFYQFNRCETYWMVLTLRLVLSFGGQCWTFTLAVFKGNRA